MTTDEEELYDAEEDPYALALRPGREPVYLRLDDGRRIRVPVHRWHEQPTGADRTVLERCAGPVLDIGCGPGRMCRALLRQGVFALGVDITPRAVALTTALGGLALHRSVFERLPAERSWRTVLLIDGNIGIGGDPRGLLRRCGDLIVPTGCLVVEVDPHDVEEQCTARFENVHGQGGPAFPWARLGRPALQRITADVALTVTDQWTSGHRCFAALSPTRDHPATTLTWPPGGAGQQDGGRPTSCHG